MSAVATRGPAVNDGAVVGSRSLDRLKLFACCLAITLLVFRQSPGDTAADTKFDLVVSPWRFLGRALQLWNPISDAGVLQNQAYGYLFPMGPYFGVLHSLDVPPWVIQRSWESAILVVAFLGVVRLTALFGIPGLWPRVAAGLAYALAPRMLSELTAISAELMPVAAMPWLLVPLVRGSRFGSPRRAGARSGVALLLAGGVNAAATLAVLPAPAVWLITRRRGRRRARLLRWWLLGVFLASLWWAIPLLLLGRYSPPFLDWIETSAATTQPLSLFSVLRGVDHWESYLGPSVWPAGNIFARASVVVVGTALVAGFGLAGMARRDVPERAFLWLLFLVGIVLLCIGHPAPAGSPIAGQVRDLLDTSLVAFRNVHKFDPLIRLPLAVGIGHLVSSVGLPDRLTLARTRAVTLPVRRYAALALIVLGVVAVTPGLTDHLVTNPRVTTEPGWWRSTGSWLAQHADGERALVVPGSSAPAYLWGRTIDDALQPVATTPWTTRDAVPLTQAGYIRLLDSIEQLTAQGGPSPVLAQLLARAGIGYVVLRNDLDTFTSVSTPTVLVRTALTTSAGFSLRTSFGPDVGGSTSRNHVLDGGLSVPRSSVEIFGVLPASRAAGSTGNAQVSLLSAADAIAANGSADQLPDLLAAGVDAQRAVLFGGDAGPLAHATGSGIPTILTDGIRRQQVSFAQLLTTSQTLAADEPYVGRRQVYDYLPDNAGALSQYAYSGGLTSVLATSSGAAPYALIDRGADHGAWSAVDGGPATSWQSSSAAAVGQSITLRFDRPRNPGTVTVSFTPGLGPMPTRVALVTKAGAAVLPVQPVAGPQTLAVPAGDTDFLTLGVAQVSGGGPGWAVGIDELRVPGLTPRRDLVVPGPATDPDLVRFQVAAGLRSGCLPHDGLVYCESAYAQSGQEDLDLSRRFATVGGGRYVPSIQVRMRPGDALNRLLAAGADVTAVASSVSSADPRVRAQAAVDGDPSTYWRAAPGDSRPTLTLHLRAPQQISGIRLSLDPRAAAARPVQIRFAAGGQQVTALVPSDGVLRLPRPVRASTATVTVLLAEPRTDTDSATIRTGLLPAGIGEATLLTPVVLRGAPPPQLVIPCVAGPTLELDGASIRFSVRAGVAQALAGDPVTATPCGTETPALTAGQHELRLAATAAVEPYSASLARVGFAMTTRAAPAGTAASVQQWGATRRVVQVHSPQLSLLVVHENFNDGWHASLAGRRLAPVRVDGWQQGWLVPAGSTGPVVLGFGPQPLFTTGLWLGLAAALAVCLLALLPGRPNPAPAVGAIGQRLIWWAPAVVLAGAAVAGWRGALVVALAAAGCLLARIRLRRMGEWPALVPPLLLLAAGIVVVSGPNELLFVRSDSVAVQLLCVLAVAVAAFAGADATEAPDAGAAEDPRQLAEP